MQVMYAIVTVPAYHHTLIELFSCISFFNARLSMHGPGYQVMKGQQGLSATKLTLTICIFPGHYVFDLSSDSKLWLSNRRICLQG